MAIFQRFGTKSVQYQIDIVLNKLFMNVNVPGCEISVILKRGDHKSELKQPVQLKDRYAKFNKQLISVPTKLYWDDKKKEFLSKMAELQINIIHQKKVRSAGKIEFDVASYATKNITSMMEQRQLQKCPDSAAKLFYEIRVHQFGDYSAYDNNSQSESQLQDDGDLRRKQQMNGNNNTNNNRGRDVSPLIDLTGMNSARGQQIQDFNQFNERSKSPMTKIDKNQVSFTARTQDQSFNQYKDNQPNSARGYQDESQQRSNLFQQTTNRLDGNNNNNFNYNRNDENNNINNKMDASTRSFNTQSGSQFNQSSYSHNSNNNINNNSNNNSNNNINGYSTQQPNQINNQDQIKNNNYSTNLSQPISPNLIGGITKQNELTNQNQMRDLFKQQKEDNLTLRQKNQELIIENDQLKQQVETIINENQRLKSKISTLESQNGSQSNIGSNDSIKKAHQQEIKIYDEQIKALTQEIKTLKASTIKDNKTEELERQLKDLMNEQELNKADQTIKFERERSLYEKRMKDLQLTNEECNQRIQELQNEIARKQKDTEYYKQLVNRSNKEETDNEVIINLQKQLQELQLKFNNMEKENKNKLIQIQEESQKLKKDKELEIVDLKRNKTESEHQIAKLNKEIDQLKNDQKELLNKYNLQKNTLQSNSNNNINNNNKNNNDDNNKTKDLQTKFEEVNNKLVKLSVERGNIEMERDNLKREMRVKDQEVGRQKYIVNKLENRIRYSKESICEMLNIILMTGDRDLIDEIEPYIIETEEQQQEQEEEYQFQLHSSSQNTFNTTAPNTLYTPTPIYQNYNNYNQFTPNLVVSDNKSQDIFKSNNFSDKNYL